VILSPVFVPRLAHVSGWDMAVNDGREVLKLISRMVAPGAVNFFDRTDGDPFGEAHARSLWPTALGSRTDEELGRVVLDVWTSGGGQ